MDQGDRLRNEGLKFYDTLLHQTDQTIVQVNLSTLKNLVLTVLFHKTGNNDGIFT